MTGPERRLLIKNTILGFKILSWELRRLKEKPLTNLSVLILLLLKDKEGLLKIDLMKTLKSNFTDIDNALNLLISYNYATCENVLEGRLNNRISVKSKRYKLTIHGELFLGDFIEKLML